MSDTNIKFIQIKTDYERRRNEQRNKLVLYLKNQLMKERDYESLNVINGGAAGKGKKTYTNANTIEPFDLTNWKWVEVRDNKSQFSCVISLNMIDIDKNSSNFHALYDRIGIIFLYKIGTNTYKNYIWTGIDLPLDETKEKKVLDLITEQYDFYLNRKKALPTA